MSWKSPNELIQLDLETKMTECVVETIQRMGINVDKDELIKALQYDRHQYVKGYADGINDSKIIRCKECKHRDPEDKKCDCGHDIVWQLPRDDNWFCADGERENR